MLPKEIFEILTIWDLHGFFQGVWGGGGISPPPENGFAPPWALANFHLNFLKLFKKLVIINTCKWFVVKQQFF